jgi:N utilization substance protein A
VVTRDDLAEMAVDEIIDIDGMTEDRASTLIMAARQHWFE